MHPGIIDVLTVNAYTSQGCRVESLMPTASRPHTNSTCCFDGLLLITITLRVHTRHTAPLTSHEETRLTSLSMSVRLRELQCCVHSSSVDRSPRTRVERAVSSESPPAPRQH